MRSVDSIQGTEGTKELSSDHRWNVDLHFSLSKTLRWPAVKVRKDVLPIRAVRLWVGLFAENRNTAVLDLSVSKPGMLCI